MDAKLLGRDEIWLLAKLSTSKHVHDPSSSGTSLSLFRQAKRTRSFFRSPISGAAPSRSKLFSLSAQSDGSE
uniref:Uncharacterized protein n=1 Tax=Knipowitschia caucasica TaxID=637954 RepID=A0AAV2JW98_KNICA